MNTEANNTSKMKDDPQQPNNDQTKPTMSNMNRTPDNDSSSKPPFFVANNQPIYFQQDWDTGIGGGLWSTGMAMAQYFSNHSSLVRRCLTNNHVKTALELGSGNGFLSVCLLASLMSQQDQQQQEPILNELVVTDLKEHLPLIARTFGGNQHVVPHFYMENESFCGDDESNAAQDQPCISTVVKIAAYQWGEFNESDSSSLPLQHKFDFIFGSDVAYSNELYQPLIQSLLHLSHERTIILLGVTMNDTKPIFFDALWDAGFTYERIADGFMMPEYRGNTFGLFVVQRR